MDAYGEGKIKMETFVDGKLVACTMNDVLFVPGMKRNLFSVKFIRNLLEPSQERA